MNRDYKQFLGCHITKERLDSFAVMLNGLKHVKRMVSNAWGLDRFDVEYEYSHVLDADVANLMGAMKDALGHSCNHITRTGDKDTNPFRTHATAKVMPWTKVENEGLKDLQDFIDRHCTMEAA